MNENQENKQPSLNDKDQERKDYGIREYFNILMSITLTSGAIYLAPISPNIYLPMVATFFSSVAGGYSIAQFLLITNERIKGENSDQE